jgi:N-acetylglucosaminyldiphosphoundecaprenol N-acetyl-beta-D-mannosaminyltransferase
VRARHPGLAVAGTHHGFFQPGDAEDMALRARIRALRPDVIITGMGMPRQEYWADAVRPGLDHGVIIAAGALFRWYTGMERRAPRWMADHGMEWLHRLLSRPVRNFRRYVVGIPAFLWRVVRSAERRA